ncbi:kinase-like domain-containing protein [Hyaloraphidium curvatum]|nr:kinase-like domain-containing protein [Hyaloraphidium curvatum]
MAPSGGPNDGEGGGARDAVNGRVPDEDEPDHDEHAPEGRHPDGQPGDGHRARRTQPVRIQTGTAVPLSRADSATSLASSASSQVSGISPSPIDKWHRALLSALSPSAHTDPFEGLLRAGLSAETCVRYQFDAHTGSWTRKEEMAMVEPEPFARGSLRECFRAKKLSNWVGEGDWTRASNLVLKHYHSVAEEPANAELVRADVRVQMTAKLLAQHFNRLHPPKQIDMLQTFVLSFPERPGAPHFCAERFIEGPYAKYNSNVGYVGGSPTDDHVRSTPQAFSHWTFEGTFGRQMCACPAPRSLLASPANPVRGHRQASTCRASTTSSPTPSCTRTPTTPKLAAARATSASWATRSFSARTGATPCAACSACRSSSGRLPRCFQTEPAARPPRNPSLRSPPSRPTRPSPAQPAPSP